MRRSLLPAVCLLAVAVVAGMGVQRASACTGVKLKARDGSLVYGRTMEFGIDMMSQPIVIPRGYALQGTAAGGKAGLAWQSKYAVVGLNGFHVDHIIDGNNEKGLAGGIFYMPGYAQYEITDAKDNARTLAPWEVITWALTNFATVDEVRSAIQSIRVAASPAPGLGLCPPCHYALHDNHGGSIVIEYLKGQLSVNDNPVGVITNSPEFSWHLTNLNNYATLRALNADSQNLGGLVIQPLSQGSGLFGLPGDFTSPARFVRAVALGHTALPGEDAVEAVEQLFHVLDSFDIPRGSVEGGDSNKPVYELTSWTSANDLQNHVFYFHTHDNRRVRRINLADQDLNAGQIVRFPAQSAQDFDDLRPQTAN